MNSKKLFAIAGIAVLALLYIITFISAIFTSAAAPGLFKACVLATFVIPVFLYGYILIYRIMKDRADKTRREIEDAINTGAETADDSKNASDESADNEGAPET